MNYSPINQSMVALDLLMQADPSEANITRYLNGSWCFGAMHNDLLVAVCVVKAIRPNVAEIFNISVYPQWQQQGIGSQLLRFTLAELTGYNIKRVELSTGTFGYQLAYYQRAEFRVDSILKNFFIDSYPEPIFENGIQHKDSLRLYLQL